MDQKIKTICLDGTNCYLIETEAGFVLIDTGYPFQRKRLDKELEREGCTSENVKLIVLTHGDIDHSGNCVYLRKKYKSKIAMHEGDIEMCLRDGITRDRGKPPKNFPPILYLWIVQSFFEFIIKQQLFGKPFETFKPDILLKDGDSFQDYGFGAKTVYTPGHSKGSISIITQEGELFCGDMMGNIWGKILKSFDDDMLIKLKSMHVKLIYPGHGRSFTMERVIS